MVATGGGNSPVSWKSLVGWLLPILGLPLTATWILLQNHNLQPHAGAVRTHEIVELRNAIARLNHQVNRLADKVDEFQYDVLKAVTEIQVKQKEFHLETYKPRIINRPFRIEEYDPYYKLPKINVKPANQKTTKDTIIHPLYPNPKVKEPDYIDPPHYDHYHR